MLSTELNENASSPNRLEAFSLLGAGRVSRINPGLLSHHLTPHHALNTATRVTLPTV